MNAKNEPPGFFGKLPSHGDFINRRVSRGFLAKWDEWLQNSVAASKAALGEEWLQIYLTSPIWNFAIAPGLCGKRGYAGVLMPSVDRVGRYFPLTITVPFAEQWSALQVAAAGSDWFVRAGEVALSGLEEEDFSIDTFDADVESLGMVCAGSQPEDSATEVFAVPESGGLCLSLDQSSGVTGSIARLADSLLRDRWSKFSVWWSDGSDQVAPSLLVCAAMPEADAFTDFLDGRWRNEQWFCPSSVSVDEANVG
jgi:type VI secretion system protein ImpM